MIILWSYLGFIFVFIVIKFTSIPDIIERIKLTIIYRSEGVWNVNLIPLRTISSQLEHLTEGWALKNLIGNIFPFVPVGFLIPLSYQGLRRLYRTFFVIFAVIALMETFQLLTGLGAFDIDDIILNLIGGTAGYFIYRIVFPSKYNGNGKAGSSRRAVFCKR
jgi:glycopeptide antibiotics resistance protein